MKTIRISARSGKCHRMAFALLLVTVLAGLSAALNASTAMVHAGRGYRGAVVTFTGWETTVPTDPST
jgi:hypothetical protein